MLSYSFKRRGDPFNIREPALKHDLFEFYHF